VGKYSVELKVSARKELERLPAKLIQRIFPKLEGLASEPRPAGCRTLKGGSGGFALGITRWSIRLMMRS
jgi:mRNA-degrading endonuclease RelE of RelBE toxin-antitoxin system